MKNRTWTKTGLTGLMRIFLATLLAAAIALPALAGPREQAKRIHDRLAGVPPSESVLTQMEALIAGNPQAAAYIAMDDPSFYNVTLKNYAAPWTNRDQSVFVPMNDYIATVIGMIRDDVDFSTLLSADLTYVGIGGVVTAGTSATSNAHYEQLEANNVDLSDPTNFNGTTQSSIQGIPSTATAGIITSRAASEAFFVAGTNRAMFRFTLLNHMCNDMEQVLDVRRTPDRIRQDVSRSPGGDSRLFLNNCIGCHSGMDPMAQAFAYYNYNETTASIEYTAGQVQPKYFNNDANFEFGFVTPDDSWENYWRNGQNQFLDWDPTLPGNGAGAKSMGEELANSGAFANCQVKKVFKAVCLREPEDAADRAQITAMVNTFRVGYSMKRSFADAAVYCMGQ